MVLVLYLGLLALLALLTAYTRNYQRTVVELDRALDAGGRLTSPMQTLRTVVVATAWPGAILVGLGFVGWWKAVALVVGAFALLTPLLGSFTPRPGSDHFLDRLEAELRRRMEREPPAERAELERIARGLAERLSRAPPG